MSVNLSVNGATGGGTTGGIAAPTSLSFAYQVGTSAPPCQNVLIASTGNFTVTPSGQFFPASTVTGPATIQVCAAVGGLSAGTFNGTLTIASSSASQSIPLTLTVYSGPILMANVNGTSGDIVCTYVSGGSGCNSSTVVVTASDQSTVPSR